MLQLGGAVYLIYHMANYIAHDETSTGCALGKVGEVSHSSYCSLFSYSICVVPGGYLGLGTMME